MINIIDYIEFSEYYIKLFGVLYSSIASLWRTQVKEAIDEYNTPNN